MNDVAGQAGGDGEIAAPVVDAHAAPVGAEPSKEGIGDQLVGLAMKALPAIGSAVGFVGFVAALGGSIEWVRFTSAGLPVNQAVGAVVQRELVIVGATALIGFIILGLAAVLAAYLVDSKAEGTSKLGGATILLAVIELTVAVFYTPSSAGDRIVFLLGMVAVAGAGLIALSPVIDSIGESVKKLSISRKTLTSAAIGLIMLALLVWMFITATKWLLLMLLVVVVLNAAVFGIARASSHFLWYGVAVFLSVPTFGALLSGIRTYRFPHVQPVALIRKSSDQAVCGIYIGESSDRLYIGRVQVNSKGKVAGTGRIFWVPASEVDMVKIGASQSVADANGRGPELAKELYEDRAEAPPLQVKPTVTQKVVQDGTSTTTTTTETPVPEPPPTPKVAAPEPLDSCTHQNLETPLKEAEEGWTPKP